MPLLGVYEALMRLRSTLSDATILFAATFSHATADISKIVCLQMRDVTLEGQASSSVTASVAEGVEHALGPTLESPNMLARAPQGLLNSELECGICLDATANIGFDSCSHSLCAECLIWCARLISFHC